MKTWTRGCGLAAVLLLCAAMAGVNARAGDGVTADALKGIYTAGAGGATFAKAVSELAGGLKQLYGVSLATVDSPEAPCLVLGRTAALQSGLLGEPDLAAVQPGGYVVRTAGDRIVIAGVSAPATVYGVRRFLEELGVRFLDQRGGAHYPPPRNRLIPPLAIATRPAVQYRNFYSRLLEWADCSRALAAEGITGTDQWIDHSAGYLLPKDLFYDAHPEYYAMLKNGKRIPKEQFTYHRTPLCLSNPDVVRITTERLLKWIEQQPDRTMFPVTYGDTGVWCQCPECLKQDPVPGQYATRLLTWVNQLAREAGRRYPDKSFITFAYGGSDAAPPQIRPAENVWICCSVGFAKLAFWDHCMARDLGRLSVEKIDRWLAIAPHQVAVCEYQGKYYPAMADTLAGKHRFYAGRGIRGILFSFGHPANLVPLWEYLYPRLLWDPSLDAQALAREFAGLHYGPAARPMAEYFDLCHERYGQTLKTLDGMDDFYPAGLYSEAYVETALDCFNRARAAAGGQAGLSSEIAGEQRAFIMDWMQHHASTTLTPETEALLRNQCDRLAELAGDSVKEKVELANRVHRIGVTLNGDLEGALHVVEDWLAGQDIPAPDVNETRPDGGVRIPAQGFLYAGWSRVYRGHSHPVPPKWGAAVYVEGNSAGYSRRMEARFALADVPAGKTAVLEIEGQDCDHEVDSAEIRVAINGTPLYEGQVQMVKWNWSRQEFTIPPGVLKKGENTIEIVNIADPASIENWFERWFMLSEAVIKFPE